MYAVVSKYVTHLAKATLFPYLVSHQTFPVFFSLSQIMQHTFKCQAIENPPKITDFDRVCVRKGVILVVRSWSLVLGWTLWPRNANETKVFGWCQHKHIGHIGNGTTIGQGKMSTCLVNATTEHYWPVAPHPPVFCHFVRLIPDKLYEILCLRLDTQCPTIWQMRSNSSS